MEGAAMNDNVTPIGPRRNKQAFNGDALDTADIALGQALGIVDLLQGAAAHGAIEPPSNEESLARTLAVVRDLLEKVRGALFPEPPDAEEDTS
jgi:hypothetical protein